MDKTRVLCVSLLVSMLCLLQVSATCVKYSEDSVAWSGFNIISETADPTTPPPTTTTQDTTTVTPTTTQDTTTLTPTTVPVPTTTTQDTTTLMPTTVPVPTTTTQDTTTLTPTTVPTTTTQDTTTLTPTTVLTTTTTAATTTTETSTSTTALSYELTTVVISGDTVPGQVIFLRGGLDYNAFGCSDENPEACMIPIEHVARENDPAHQAWAHQDLYLDWGVETNQGVYEGQEPQGTPGYYQDRSWVFEFLMDCDATDNGWFELKGFFQDYNTGEGFWEDWIHDSYECAFHGNHQAACGQTNYFTWNQSYCERL